jgi:hypothetical protein
LPELISDRTLFDLDKCNLIRKHERRVEVMHDLENHESTPPPDFLDRLSYDILRKVRKSVAEMI